MYAAENNGRKKRSIESAEEFFFNEMPNSSGQHSWKKKSQASFEVEQNITRGEFKFKGIAEHILKTWVSKSLNNQMYKK